MKRAFLISILCILLIAFSGDAHSDFYRDKVVVLLYHEIADTRKNSATIPPLLFRKHMAILEQNFNVISLDDVVAFQNGTKSIPPNAVAITFDDGYRSNYDIAYPILKQHDWPATVFLTLNDVGRINPTLEWLTWEQITEMSAHKFSFGSHSCTHGTIGNQSELVTQYPGESWQDYQTRVASGLQSSYQILSDYGVPTLHFAAPFGQFNETVKEAAYKAGFKYLWGVDSYPVMGGYQSLYRIDVGAYWVSPRKLRQQIIDTAKRTPPSPVKSAS